MSTIEVTISPRGETTLQTHGFQGNACQDASRSLEQLLGTVVQVTRTAEFYEAAVEPLSVPQTNTTS